MNDDEKWNRCYNVTVKERSFITEFKGRTPLCKVYATLVDHCKTCPWYNSHLLEYEE